MHPNSKQSITLQLNHQEMEALRDGLIQCLSLVYNELTSRPQKAPGSVAAAAPAAPVEDPTERIVRSTAGPAAGAEVASAAASGEIPISQEAKLALGLLVCNRTSLPH
jgi:hypothetical protein